MQLDGIIRKRFELVGKKGFSKRKSTKSDQSANARVPEGRLPKVSICTISYNRTRFLNLLQRLVLQQTYPHELIEWIILDDSDPDESVFTPDSLSTIHTIYRRLDKRHSIGAKRNLIHTMCNGDIIINMDDDDYYPPTRVAHAVERLMNSDCLIAGSTQFPVFFLHEQELWITGPFHDKHATAGTFAFKRELLNNSRYDETVERAEETSFLKNYTLPIVQLDPAHTIVCFAHERNTFDKRLLKLEGKNPNFRRQSDSEKEALLGRLGRLIEDYEAAGRIYTSSMAAPEKTFLLNPAALTIMEARADESLTILLVQEEDMPCRSDTFWSAVSIASSDKKVNLVVVESSIDRLSSFVAQLEHPRIRAVRCSEKASWAERLHVGFTEIQTPLLMIVDIEGYINLGFCDWWHRIRETGIAARLTLLLPIFTTLGDDGQIDKYSHLIQTQELLGDENRSLRAELFDRNRDSFSLSGTLTRKDATHLSTLIDFAIRLPLHKQLLIRCYSYALAWSQPVAVSRYSFFVRKTPSCESSDRLLVKGFRIETLSEFRSSLKLPASSGLELDQIAALLQIQEAAIACTFFEAYMQRAMMSDDWDESGYLEAVVYFLKGSMLSEIRYRETDLARVMLPTRESLRNTRSILTEGITSFVGGDLGITLRSLSDMR